MIRAIVTALLLACTGCSVLQPVRVAETPEQKADALYATYVIFQRRAVAIAEQPATPDRVVQALARADAAAAPVMNSMYDALLLVNTVRDEVRAGETPEEQLTVVTLNLERWVDEAVPLVYALLEAVTSFERPALPEPQPEGT